MDLFDPKPALTKHQGKPYPGQLEIHFDKQAGKLLASPFQVSSHMASREWCSASSFPICRRSSTT